MTKKPLGDSKPAALDPTLAGADQHGGANPTQEWGWQPQYADMLFESQLSRVPSWENTSRKYSSRTSFRLW
jgi:hypothetical protein